MADFKFNIALGRSVYYCTLPAANDALIVVPIEASGVEADDTLNNYDDLAALLAAANNEQTTLGRKTITSITVTVDDTNNRVDVDFADPVWVGAAGNAVSDLLMCYDSDTTGGTDSGIVPMTGHDFVVTPAGDLTGVLAATGFLRAA